MKFDLQLSNVGFKEVRSETGVQAGGDATIPRSGWPTEMLGKIYSIVLVVDYAISTRLTRKAGMIHKLKTMGPRTNRPRHSCWFVVPSFSERRFASRSRVLAWPR